MRLLFTADLHDRADWRRWILDQSHRFDFIGVGGDVLDAFAGEMDRVQIPAFVEWVQQLKADGIPLAFCSGNHDRADRPFDGLVENPDFAGLYPGKHWMEFLRDDHCVVCPESRLMDIDGVPLVITSFDWSGPDPDSSALLAEGARLKAQAGAPWIWLRHAPPAHAALHDRPLPDNDPFLEAILQWRPTAVLSGHYHDAPFRPGGAQSVQIGETLCINPGHQVESPTPGHFVLELG